MKKIVLVGRSGAGKTTLTQAIKGQRITYHKTRYIDNYDVTTDAPGECTENKTLARALVLYFYEADAVGLLVSTIGDYSLYSPHIVFMATREVVGVVTQINQSDARSDLAAIRLELTDYKKMFYANSVTDEGVGDILGYLREEGDVIPWEGEEKTDEANVDVGRWLRGGL